MVDDIMDIKVESTFFSTGNGLSDASPFDRAAVTVKVEQDIKLDGVGGAISTGKTSNFIDCSEALTWDIKEEKVDPLEAVDSPSPVEEVSLFTDTWGTSAIHKVEDLGVDEEEGGIAQVNFNSCVSSLNREDSSYNDQEFDTAIKNEEASHASVLQSFPCPSCAARFKTKNDLDRHSISHLRRLSCKYCAATFETKFALVKHLDMHPNMRQKLPNISPRKILPRGKIPLRAHSLETEDNLNNNLINHRKILPRGKMPLKVHSLGTKDNLNNNFITHQIQKPLSTTYYPILLRSEDHSTQHVTIQQPEKQFLCQQCPATFATKTTLKQHSVVHSSVQFFYCPHCTVFFKTQICLQKHLMTHLSTKPAPIKQSLITISPRTILPRPTMSHQDNRFMGHCNNTPSSEPSRKDTVGFFSELHFTKPKAKTLKLKVVNVSRASAECTKLKKTK